MTTLTITLLPTLLRQRTIGTRVYYYSMFCGVCSRRYLHCDNHIAYKMNIKTDLLEEYVNFVDVTKKRNIYFKKVILLVAIIVALVLLFVLLKHLTE